MNKLKIAVKEIFLGFKENPFNAFIAAVILIPLAIILVLFVISFYIILFVLVYNIIDNFPTETAWILLVYVFIENYVRKNKDSKILVKV